MNTKNSKRLAILGTLDTRGDEVDFLRKLIEDQGHRAIVIDMGVMGKPMQGAGDYPREAVATAGGRPLHDLIADANAGKDRGDASKVMIAGAHAIVAELVSKSELDGIMALGGSTAAAAGAEVMSGLPIGFPKLLLTTFQRLAPIGEEDITVMQSPADLIGLNAVIMRTLANAAGALIGMAMQPVPTEGQRPVVGITALGVTTPAVMAVISGLEKLGYDSVAFHATTDKLDRMIADGIIDAVIDLTTFEATVKLCYSAEMIQAATGTTHVDRSRLASLSGKTIPQIIAPGGLDMHILQGVRSAAALPEAFRGRAHAQHGPEIMLVRTSSDEMEIVARSLADRINQASGPVAAIIPLRGFSDASRAGAALHAPETDRAFISTLESQVTDNTTLHEVDCNINDPAFAETVIETFKKLTA